MFRNILSVITGLFSAFLIVLILEKTLPLLFNVAPFDESKDANALNDYIRQLPVGLLTANAITYGIAAFAGGYITQLISQNQNMGMIMTLIFFIVVMVNFLSFQHPTWIIALGAIVTIMGGYAGSNIGKKAI